MGGEYAPFTTSYDYDAPLSEDGRPTPKFNAIKKRLRAMGAAARPPPPTFTPLPPPPLAAYKRVDLTEWLPLLTCDAVTTATAAAVGGDTPLTMEALPMAHGGRYGLAGQRHGFLLYRTTLQHTSTRAVTLRLPEVHDRAQVRC
jgi:beta-galactosidase